MHILFVGKRFYTNRDALEEKFGRIYQLPAHWSEAGCETKLWLIDYHTRAVVHRLDKTMEVLSTPVLSLACIVRFFREVMRKRTPARGRTVVVASGDCYIALLGWVVARCTRATFVFDIYDKYDEFRGYRRFAGFDLFGFLLKRSEKRFFASQALMRQLGHDPVRDSVAANGIDSRRFRPLPMGESRRILGLPDDADIVGYFGSMEADRGIDDLIEALAMLHDEGLEVMLVLAGKSRNDLNLRRPGIRYLGNLPFGQMPRALASCDVLALPYRESMILDMSSSCKIAEYLSMLRPLAATCTPNLVSNFPVQASQLGNLLARPHDRVDLARVIKIQLSEKHLVDPPTGFDWRVISENALSAL
ncbi:glycosyltransferase [Rhodanobacter sp. UC4437_H4]